MKKIIHQNSFPYETKNQGTPLFHEFIKKFAIILLLLVSFTFVPDSMNAQFTQQGNKLVGTGAVNSPAGAFQGFSVALSSDGNTAIVGGRGDDNFTGAAWVYTRSSGVWTQQGSKLVGTGGFSPGNQGASVSLSSDGNTAIVGGYGDNNSLGGEGGAWVYTRSGGVWTQQGSKLVGTGATNPSYGVGQGSSVSLSSDGNTAIMGGYADSNYVGAVWVFTRSGGVWTQQGSKLVGTGAVGSSRQGISVSLSSDGNTAFVGGGGDNYSAGTTIGAAWVFTRSAGVWTQQGSKLVGTGAVGNAEQGFSVAISSDGNTAVVGGSYDNSQQGAVWVYTRSGGVWAQQGNKLVGTGGENATSSQGFSVSLSSDGNTAIEGGSTDNGNAGAAWVFTRSGGVWAQQGSKLVGTGAVGNAWQGTSIALSSDGSTAIVGGNNDNNYAGAAWVYSSGTSGIENINARQRTVLIYPDPAKTVLNIHLSSYTPGETLLITDVLGNEVYKEPLIGIDNSLTISNWSKGVYFYEVRGKNEKVVGKFVVWK